MQWFTYQHNDGTDDVAPYTHKPTTFVNLIHQDYQDYRIMRLRTLAHNRGATPAEIARNVMALEIN